MSGQDVLQNSGFTGCLSKAGLAEGTNAGTIQIAAPNGAGVDYGIDGICYHKADADNLATGAAAVQAINTSCLYLVELNSDGDLSITKGTEQLTASLGDNLSLQWPPVSADKCPIGGIKVEVDETATFTLGTTDLGAANVTDTYYDFAVGIPLAPQVA